MRVEIKGAKTKDIPVDTLMEMINNLTDSLMEFYKTKLTKAEMKNFNISIIKYGDIENGIFIELDGTNIKE